MNSKRGQLAGMRALAAGRDGLAVMPTGYGKSSIYQVAALQLHRNPGQDKAVDEPGSARRGPAAVVSPLIALQKPLLSTELDRLTRDMAESSDWSDYHQADEQFHQLVGTASGLGTAVEAYHETLAELYAYFIPYPIDLLHKSNCDHVALVAALRAGDGNEAVEISRKHVNILHRTMFMGLTGGGDASTAE